MFKEKHEETSPLRNADNFHAITPDLGSNDVAKQTSQSFTLEERVANKMFSYIRKIIYFFLAITFTALAALHNSPPKVSKPPVAKPFFNQSSIVLDFYKGHLGAMVERVAEADFSFVMYYAPWDAESQAVRQEFEKVAQYHHTQMFFAAINCWHPSSECRAQYNKVESYPVLMLYPSRDSGIQYRGIRTLPYMIRFLNTVMNPIVRITHKDQLRELLVKYDAVVIGYFNFTRLDKTPGYREFYKAALRALERDPNRELVFAIVTGAKSNEFDYGVYKFPSAELLMWNESIRYPEESEWTSANILSWVSNSIHQPALWLQPPGIKALTLAPYLREGPVLFLFTPRNPFYLENYNYNLIREIGLQYYNCADNRLVKDIIEQLQHNRRVAAARHSKKQKECVKLLKETKNQVNESTVSVNIQQWINDSCCANVVMNKCSLCEKNVMHSMAKGTSTCLHVSHKPDRVCKGVDVFRFLVIEDERERYKFCCDKGEITIQLHESLKSKSPNYKASSFNIGKNDSRSAYALGQAYLKQDCKRWLSGSRYHPPVFPKDFDERPNINLTDAVCKVNKTLALVVIDSLRYYHFAEVLGIDVLRKKDKTAVIILDAFHESQYVMQDEFSRYNLIQFINNYTQGFLQRTLRSNNAKRFANKFKTQVTCHTKSPRRICIPELTTDTFLDTILDPLKDVVVMYFSPYCAFCGAISYVYLTVAHYLRGMDHLLFVRVDGDNNDLPWEYNMNRFPSILFFPAKRKEDSTVYPFSLPITIPNLLDFVIANLDGDSHVEARINICQSGAGEPPDTCIARTRWLCLDIIQQLLHDYRKLIRHLRFLDRRIARNKWKVILLKLEHIKDVHLILGSTVNLKKDQDKVQLVRRKYRKYYKTIRLVELDSKVNNNRKKDVISEESVGAYKVKRDKSEL